MARPRVGVVAYLLVAACRFSGPDGTGSAEPDAIIPPDAPAAARPCTLLLGSDHSCVRRNSDSSVGCAGSQGSGELGNGTIGGSSATVVTVPLGAAVRSAASRFFHTCAALADGTARCWGQNDRAQLGDGTTTTRPDPTPVTGLSDVVQIATARSFSCARRGDDSVTCWGENTSGQLGDGSYVYRPTPATTVPLAKPPVTIVLGSSHACARFADGTGACWGNNVYGQLGNGTIFNSPMPVPLPVDGVVQIATGGYSVGGPVIGGQTCALRADGTIRCWGSNDFGQLGTGLVSSPVLGPVDVTGVTDAVELVMGRYHVCARHAAGEVSCWGRNENGQIGDGLVTPRLAPYKVTLPRPAVHVAAGGYHSCALLDDDTVHCWGANASGQLGDGTRVPRSMPSPSQLCR